MRFNKWKCENHLQITQPTPSVIISFLKQVKTKVNGLLMMWHEVCVCVPVFCLCPYFKLFQVTQYPVRAHYGSVEAELTKEMSSQVLGTPTAHRA